MKTLEESHAASTSSRSEATPRTRYVDREEFNRLLVSRRRLVRVRDLGDDTQRISDPLANVVFVVNER